MKQVCLSLILSAVFLLPAAELPGWFSRGGKGRIGMGELALSLTHLSPAGSRPRCGPPGRSALPTRRGR
ncbi:MAG: hypothetical protein L6W00_17265 [Lentisphaeria bacterium]|nr:MAG: hypothetical protein L6W00_17265 [Lentisphaeria bacterium]